MTQQLIPPDYEQCQAEIKEGSFMTLGPRSYIRCKNKPVWIAIEAEAGEDGLKGSMSLCDECKGVLIQKCGEGFCTFERITEECH